MLTIDMIPDICCPTCRAGILQLNIKNQENNKITEGNFYCNFCKSSYPISAGISDFIPYGTLNIKEWQVWKNHLNGFQERRKQRILEPNRIINKLGKKSNLQEAFAQFIKIKEGKVLDVGCGPGKFRFLLGNDNITYYGSDPIVLPEVEDFRFVRSLAEYIPFKDNTFSHIVIMSALDHFREIDTFMKEAIRVLKADGKLNIIQSIHEVQGLRSGVKMLTHWIKDVLEDHATKTKSPDVPKHLSEFTKSSLLNILSQYFKIETFHEFDDKWYTPNKLFISLSPKI
jgi:ubiquinone/menaquinone biosynthesis C-methylase UbiE/uncharacterized protein YbaR (Trm112 family)